jgi:hypothetical protein
MPDEPIRERIAALHAQTPAQIGRLTAILVGACGQDHIEPGALDWVRRWRPQRIGAVSLECTCAQGRCTVCN